MDDKSFVMRLFQAIESSQPQFVLNLYDSYARVYDPVLGVIQGENARYCMAMLLCKLSTSRITIRQVSVNPFYAQIKWQVKSKTPHRLSDILCSRGSVFFEFTGTKIYRQVTEYNLCLLLGCIYGGMGYIPFLNLLLKRKLKRSILSQLENYKTSLKKTAGKMP